MDTSEGGSAMEGAERREQRVDLGLRLMRRAVAEGGHKKTIETIRRGCVEDGIPEADVEAAYERGYREFDAARNASPQTTTPA